MSVDFDGSADYIKFADSAIYDDIPTKSIFVRFTLDGNGSGTSPYLIWKTPANPSTAGWSILYNVASDRLRFSQTGTSGLGVWHTTTNSVPVGSSYTFGVSMDIGNINNNAILYLDGVEDTTTISNAAGAFNSDAGDGLFVGRDNGTQNEYFEGPVAEICFANAIWTADEFADMHKTPIGYRQQRGVIFYPLMYGAAGLQSFDGAALGASNVIVDQVNGIIGTPTSNPLGVADTVLAV